MGNAGLVKEVQFYEKGRQVFGEGGAVLWKRWL